MLLASSLIALLVSTSAVATPIVNSADSDLDKRSDMLSSQWDSEAVPGGIYTLSNNLWGQGADPTGTQSTQLLSNNGSSVSWITQYVWGGYEQYNVKSYANIALEVGLGKPLQAINSIPTIWKWSYKHASSDLVADVSYDLWLSDVPGSYGATSDSTYEVMIWLSSRGQAGPAGSQVAVNLTIGSSPVSWQLLAGVVQNWQIFSFVPDKATEKFEADLLPFFEYLMQNQSVPSSSLLVGLQAGTEPFSGKATLKTKFYSAAIN